MSDREKILDKAEMTIVFLPQKDKPGLLDAFLALVVQAEIEWEDGTKERIALAGREKIQPSKKLKKIVGKQRSMKEVLAEAGDVIKNETLENLKGGFFSGLNKVIEKRKIYGKKFKSISIGGDALHLLPGVREQNPIPAGQSKEPGR